MPAVKDQIVDGFEGLQQVFDELHDRAEQADFTDTLDGIVNRLDQQHQENYTSRASPIGDPWAPRKDNLPHPLLELSGRMRASLTEGGPDHIFVESPNEFEWGTSTFYAGFHQFGTVKMVDRPFVGMDESFVDETAEFIADDFVNIIRN